VSAHAIALKQGHGPQQAGMQTHAIQRADRHILVLRIGRRMAGVGDLMSVHRPDRAVAQLGKRAEPVALRQMAREHLVGSTCHFRHHCAPPLRVQGIEPGAACEIFPAVLARLQEVASGVALAQHPLDARTQELLVAQARCVTALAAVIAHQAERRLEKRLIYCGMLHVSIIYLHSGIREVFYGEKPLFSRRRVPDRAPCDARAEITLLRRQNAAAAMECPVKPMLMSRQIFLAAISSRLLIHATF
jgi:hypothetical protein